AETGDPPLAALLIVLGALAANFPVMVSPRYKPDATPDIYLALILLFPPALAAALVGLTRLLGEGVLCFRVNPATGHHRRAPIDLVFNTSQAMIAAGGAALTYAVLAPQAGLSSGLFGALPAAVAAAVVM